MSHYKPYPAYKDSGVEWIGEVPEHWDVLRLANIGPLIKGNGGTKADDAHDGIPCIRYGDLYTTYDLVIQNIKKFIIPESAPDYAEIQFGDLLFAASGETFEEIGKSAINLDDRQAVCGGDIIILRPRRKINPIFLAYAAGSVSAQAQKSLMGKGFTVIHVYGGSLRNLLIAGPPDLEQDQIGTVINRETTRIDALITKKTRFIEILKEKRQALIAHAVTKGLDPNVKMKDSGVKWIREVPEHWDFVPSNSLFPESKERAWADDEHLSATQKYGVIPLAEYERLEDRQVTHAVKNTDQRKHAEVGNFVISMRSFEGGIERVKARGCVRSSYVVLKASEKANIGFFTYLFKSSAYIQGLQATATFIRDGQDLSYNNFRQVKIPCPSIDEQKSIADFLEKSVTRIDALSKKTQRSIDLLKERRSAFITAAVTGQIDLREAA